MDKSIVILLLENLVERIAQHPQTQKWRLGTLSNKEKIALEQAIVYLQEQLQAAPLQPPTTEASSMPPEVVAVPSLDESVTAAEGSAEPILEMPLDVMALANTTVADVAIGEMPKLLAPEAAVTPALPPSFTLAFPTLLPADITDSDAIKAMTEVSEVVQSTLPVSSPLESSIQEIRSKAIAEGAEGGVLLNRQALALTETESPALTLCLDFGTARSKAFAMEAGGKPVELALGNRAGGTGYAVDSTLFITNNGLIIFGSQAIDFSVASVESGRTRFDSPKARLSMGEQGEIDQIWVDANTNPTAIPMSEGELITLYLAYLTDLAVSELVAQGYSRYVRRRFARPCWSEERNRWAEPLLRRMLAQAQILADTFHERWQTGITVAEAKEALTQIQALSVLPEYLLDQSIPEPVAAAASLMLRDEAQREIFMVVDVGAGTTDFGLFFLQHNPDKEICITRVIPNSVQYIPQAGNRIDDLLKFYVLDHEGIDPSGVEGRHNKVYLESRIRWYKEQLFRQGTTEITLANHARVHVQLKGFLATQRVRNFAALLQKKVEEILNSIGEGYLDLLSTIGLRVVLTGGGAGLPMVRALAQGVVEVKGRKILRKATAAVPEWIEESYPQFAPLYSQLAVAIGGAAEDLPEEGQSFPDFKGLSTPRYQL